MTLFDQWAREASTFLNDLGLLMNSYITVLWSSLDVLGLPLLTFALVRLWMSRYVGVDRPYFWKWTDRIYYYAGGFAIVVGLIDFSLQQDQVLMWDIETDTDDQIRLIEQDLIVAQRICNDANDIELICEKLHAKTGPAYFGCFPHQIDETVAEYRRTGVNPFADFPEAAGAVWCPITASLKTLFQGWSGSQQFRSARYGGPLILNRNAFFGALTEFDQQITLVLMQRSPKDMAQAEDNSSSEISESVAFSDPLKISRWSEYLGYRAFEGTFQSKDDLYESIEAKLLSLDTNRAKWEELSPRVQWFGDLFGFLGFVWPNLLATAFALRLARVTHDLRLIRS